MLCLEEAYTILVCRSAANKPSEPPPGITSNTYKRQPLAALQSISTTLMNFSQFQILAKHDSLR